MKSGEDRKTEKSARRRGIENRCSAACLSEKTETHPPRAGEKRRTEPERNCGQNVSPGTTQARMRKQYSRTSSILRMPTRYPVVPLIKMRPCCLA